MNKTANIFREIERKETGILNILDTNIHESYQTNLSKTGHNFYCYNYPGVKTWNKKFRKQPDNYKLLHGNGISQIPQNIQFDLVISGNKFGCWQNMKPVSMYLGIPLINVEHTASNFGPNVINKIHSMQSDVDVFISNWSLKSWKYENKPNVVIHHGVDTETFKPKGLKRENKILSIANDYINRDYCLNYSQFRRVTNGLDVSIYGDTKGLSEPAKSEEHLVELYNSHRIFINTANLSPIPSVVLEAASCGCAIVSIRACAIEEYLTHGYDCLLADNDNQLRLNLETLMNNEELARKLGENARKTISEKFNLEKFVSNWNNLFWSTVNDRRDC